MQALVARKPWSRGEEPEVLAQMLDHEGAVRTARDLSLRCPSGRNVGRACAADGGTSDGNPVLVDDEPCESAAAPRQELELFYLAWFQPHAERT